jgi:hypothetical protein
MGPALSRVVARLIALLLLLAPLCAGAQFDHQHTAWTALLQRHVVVNTGATASRVNYAGLAGKRAALKRYLATLSAVESDEFNAWSKPRRLAFLLNAYNAHMIERVLTRYPDIQSVWDFGRVFNHPFKTKFFRMFGRDMSLDGIEHDLIRAPGAYDDVRIHFAVNCASIGCPLLREEAYSGDRLDTQLDEQTVRFLADRTRNRYNMVDGALEVSPIFKWYAGDFSGGARGINSREEFFARHAALLADDETGRRRIADKRAPLRFLDYDWRLNDSAR